jgi:hypothetical protein
MRKTGLPAFLAVSAAVGLLLAALLIAAGTAAHWLPGALAVLGTVLLVLVAGTAAVLVGVDLMRSRSAGEYAWATARALVVTAFLLGMWSALTVGPEPGLYVLCLFGAIVALALMFLFALAKAPGASTDSAEPRSRTAASDRSETVAMAGLGLVSGG